MQTSPGPPRDNGTPPFLGRWPLARKKLRFAGLLLLGLALLPVAPLLGRRATPVVRWWYGRMLGVLGVALSIGGQPPAGPALLVANHCSWLDILVFGHAFDTAFISKAEIGDWPMVGAYARATGTLFLPRGAGRTAEMSNQIRAVLDGGRAVMLFAEGTTTPEPRPKRFHGRLFAAAIEGGYPVVPIALRYSDAHTPSHMHHALVPWVGEAPLWPHFRDLVRLRRLRAELRLCPPIDPRGFDRRRLAEASRRAITCRQARAAAASRENA